MLRIKTASDYDLKCIRKKGNGQINGIFLLDDPTYRMQPGLSASLLKEFAVSPAQYKNALTAPRVPTPAMAFGIAAHHKILEPEKFNKFYVMEPAYDGPRNRNPWKAEWEKFKDQNKGKTILTRDQWKSLCAMQEALFGMHYTARYFEEGHPEASMFWTDPHTGIQCKAKVDWISEKDGIIDYKTTSNPRFGGSEEAVEQALSQDVANFRYWLQKAHYLSGLSALDANCEHAFTFIFQKTYGGFEAVPYYIDHQDMEWAFTKRATLMERFKDCKERDSWPGLTYQLIRGSLPRWAFA